MSLECVRFQPPTTDNVYLLLSLAEMRSEVTTSVLLSGYCEGMSGWGVKYITADITELLNVAHMKGVTKPPQQSGITGANSGYSLRVHLYEK